MQEEIMPKGYSPLEVEEKWYEYWEKNSLFRAETGLDKKPYCIVIPPPNVTGTLHMGHALNNTLQDILCRRPVFPPYRGHGNRGEQDWL